MAQYKDEQRQGDQIFHRARQDDENLWSQADWALVRRFWRRRTSDGWWRGPVALYWGIRTGHGQTRPPLFVRQPQCSVTGYAPFLPASLSGNLPRHSVDGDTGVGWDGGGVGGGGDGKRRQGKGGRCWGRRWLLGWGGVGDMTRWRLELTCRWWAD